ncbi:hypothetical protein VP01_178g5 [Puccinia sorghi]|uniref:HTH APSES-type domain-containing protein n=1 Tax=Puccinia sorghi TaxID=27349 RepID=A0A0L6VEG5_9BASI|nr:hypothetical protein VP01_178g5 [Puccinia sorghi]
MSQKSIYKSHNPPELPSGKFNQILLNYQGKLRSVRTQDIKLGPLQQSIITIARIKMPAPDKISSHLIKRFDTNAISASSFFRSAFPHASDEEETTQMTYLHQIYDTHSAGAMDLGLDHRLTGVWVPLENAAELAEVYGISRFAAPLIAFPNPNTSPASPTATKKAGENDSSNVQTPKPKQADPTHATRSSKRSRAGPLSFGNTSPSSFSLSSISKPSNDINKSNASEPAPPNTDKPASPTNLAPSRAQKNSPSKTRAGDDPPSTAGQQLIGSDEVANQAKQEALKLVSELKSAQAVTQPSTERSTNSVESESQKTSPKKGEQSLDRKRSVDEVLSEEAVEEEEAEAAEEVDQPEAAGRRSFLPKLLWRRSHANSKKIKRQQSAGSSSKSFVQLPATSAQPLVDPLLSPLNPNKRNLAIAGIVIAGAAASIAPYFF